ncbi:MAG: YggS family pyridoxal phosphate-dependent enzyme [Planctomycetota bacterium]
MNIGERLAAIAARIAAACAECDRDPGDVQLLAVSKTRSVEDIRSAYASGQRCFGENRVQELCAKAPQLEALDVTWHMIGSVQTNKLRDLLRVPHVALLHSLDRMRLADRLQVECAALGRSLSVLLQVNASREPAKHGVLPEAAAELMAAVVADRPAVDVQGLMAMGPREGDPARVFAQVAALGESLRQRFGRPLPVLSLGMTGDLEAAIAAGATLVRVGTGVFGPRA